MCEYDKDCVQSVGFPEPHETSQACTIQLLLAVTINYEQIDRSGEDENFNPTLDAGEILDWYSPSPWKVCFEINRGPRSNFT